MDAIGIKGVFALHMVTVWHNKVQIYNTYASCIVSAFTYIPRSNRYSTTGNEINV